LWGGLARLDPEGGLAPLFGRQVRRHAWSLTLSNLLLVSLLFFLGAATRGAPFLIAWEAHGAGFVAGLLLIGPFLKLAGRGRAVDTVR
jgi:membrane associated rhomboid family serine protease